VYWALGTAFIRNLPGESPVNTWLGSSVRGITTVMKFFLAVASLLVVFGCSTANHLIFGAPKRYIDRDAKAKEMIGTWEITPESVTSVDKFINESKWWITDAPIPWKAITLNGDKTCDVRFEINWLPNENAFPTSVPHPLISNDVLVNDMVSCRWKISTRIRVNKEVPAFHLDFEYPNNTYSMDSLYIYEENGRLILWDFIGNPDYFIFQDFVKTK